MKSTPRIPVIVHVILMNLDAQPVDIEVGVGSLKGIESPVDEIEALGEHAISLLPFELFADSVTPILGNHCQHVGTMEDETLLAAHDATDESDHGIAVKGPDAHATASVRGHQLNGGNCDIPNANLYFDTLLVVGDALGVTEVNFTHGERS